MRLTASTCMVSHGCNGLVYNIRLLLSSTAVVLAVCVPRVLCVQIVSTRFNLRSCLLKALPCVIFRGVHVSWRHGSGYSQQLPQQER